MSLDLYKPKYGSNMEHAVVRALVEYLVKHGWWPTHANDGEQIHKRKLPCPPALPWVMDIVFSVDESAVRFTHNGKGHDVVFRLGNEWYCTIADWRYSEDDEDGFDYLMSRFTDALNDDTPVSLSLDL